MIQKLGKIGYYLFLGFLGVIALAIISTILPIPGNFQVLVVQSGSMEPAVRTGALVVVKPTSEYRIGEVITFGPVTKTKPPTSHRIVDMEVAAGQISYVTKGDANEDADPKPVAEQDVLGKVLVSAPYLGYVLDLARQPGGFLLIIGIPALVIVGDEMRKIIVEVKKLRSKKDSNFS